MTLQRPSLTRDTQSVLFVVEQSPRGGSHVREGTVVKLLALDVSNPFAGRRFSSRVWQAHPDCNEDANPRGRMYSDLAGCILRY